MNQVDYDLLILGGGPAGLTAGLYATRAKLNTLLLEKTVPGGQILVTDWIENYPGFPEGISGLDLVQKMTEQATRFGLNIESNEVLSVDFSGPVKKVSVSDRTLTAHAVILCTGASPQKLGVPGEDRFYGRGVSFCATCDAPFYKNRVVVAVGGGDTAVQESLYLTKFAKKVYLVHRRDKLRAEAILQERALSNPKIEVLWDTVVTDVLGGLTNVEGVRIKNVKSGESRDISADGCFIWVGIQPATGFLKDAVERDEFGFIPVNQKMETSVSGVFAAGDVRTTPLRQVVTAVGDAAIAVNSAQHYLESIL
ncbi:MAG: thioredoxin-disulfide reductase [Proteobacteria bacterium]|nr:thioredoxin-disulfide reductase [Pseudomonadota bacterium]MBU4469733.1 thioredoxin-disulfide reductase [Pseudomonadota bacterium]MCG2753887.1 thioredoxin-disulfide reductase [Desulfobacteraceae bacterium]